MASDRLALLGQARLRIALLVVAGVVGALAFPRTDWWLFAWVWLTPVLCCALARPVRSALADGWFAGTIFFVVLLAAYCGLYVGAVTAGVAWLRPRIGEGWALGMAPVLWVAGEWIRGHLM